MAHVIWLQGISGSGKTTLGVKLVDFLKQKTGNKVQFLDGDVIRDFFQGDLGFTRAERILNVRRIAFAAYVLAKNDVDVVVANIAPYYEVREFIKSKMPDYIQVFLKASSEKVIERDVQGHYKKAKMGLEKNLIGMDDPYESPRNPDLMISTDTETIDESFERLTAFLKEKKVYS